MAIKKKHTTFLMADSTIQILEELKKEINKKYNLSISKGEIVEVLLHNTSANEITNNIRRII